MSTTTEWKTHGERGDLLFALSLDWVDCWLGFSLAFFLPRALSPSLSLCIAGVTFSSISFCLLACVCVEFRLLVWTAKAENGNNGSVWRSQCLVFSLSLSLFPEIDQIYSPWSKTIASATSRKCKQQMIRGESRTKEKSLSKVIWKMSDWIWHFTAEDANGWTESKGHPPSDEAEGRMSQAHTHTHKKKKRT